MRRLIKAALALARLPADFLLLVVTHLPGPGGDALRRVYWRCRLRRLGPGSRIDTGVYFQDPGRISIGAHCWIDKGVIILAGTDASSREKVLVPNPMFQGDPGSVSIGDNVHVSPGCIISGISAGIQINDDCGLAAGCKLYAFSHHYASRRSPENEEIVFGPMAPHDGQCLIEGPITLGWNAGLGANCVVLPGTAIPERSFVAANSVVHPRRFSPNSLIAGDPAARVRDRFIKR